MQIVYLLLTMTAVGLLIGWLAGIIWKGRRPIGLAGDLITAVLSAIVLGLLDWYVIPAMGFSDSMRNLGVALEPAILALLVLWIIRKVKK